MGPLMVEKSADGNCVFLSKTQFWEFYKYSLFKFESLLKKTGFHVIMIRYLMFQNENISLSMWQRYKSLLNYGRNENKIYFLHLRERYICPLLILSLILSKGKLSIQFKRFSQKCSSLFFSTPALQQASPEYFSMYLTSFSKFPTS